MAKDTVDLLGHTAEALSLLGLGDVVRVNSPEHMAWVARVLRHVPDSETAFPSGKWATIQHIEAQVDECAKVRAAEIASLVSAAK